MRNIFSIEVKRVENSCILLALLQCMLLLSTTFVTMTVMRSFIFFSMEEERYGSIQCQKCMQLPTRREAWVCVRKALFVPFLRELRVERTRMVN